VPPTEHLGTLEIPVSFWGKEEKNCPVCNQTILAAAIRCRNCGATFKMAAPETTADFRQRRSIEMSLPSVRKASIWILVLASLTCTAPIMAVVAPIWYRANRRKIKALPAINAAICKIAVGVALAQTFLIVLFMVLYHAFGK
jgi:hypothetical protein